MTGRLCRLAFSSLFFSAVFVLSQVAQGGLVFTDPGNGRLYSANDDGSGLTLLVSDEAGVRDLVIDSINGRLYWTTVLTDIRMSNLDGSGVSSLGTGIDDAVGIDLDRANDRLYWTNPGTAQIQDEIQSALLDGSGLTTHLIFPVIHDLPQGLALDIAGGKMYWADVQNGTIERANLDGSGRETIITVSHAKDVELDLVNGLVYFAGQNTVGRASLDGSGRVDLVTGVGSVFEGINGLALDLDGGKLYWTQQLDNFSPHGIIRVANLDGSSAQTIISGLTNPWGIEFAAPATVPEPSSLALICTGGVTVLSYRWRRRSQKVATHS